MQVSTSSRRYSSSRSRRGLRFAPLRKAALGLAGAVLLVVAIVGGLG
jgi:hypothetical protein